MRGSMGTVAIAPMLAAGLVAGLLAGGTAGAQQPAAKAAPTAQQLFDAAVALDGAPDAAAAARAWLALEQRSKPGSRSRAIAQVRRGGALIRAGDRAAAGESLRAGLAALPAADPALAEDRLMARLRLAALALDALDYASAADFYVAAEADAADPSTKLVVLLGQVQAMTFVDPDRARAALARAEAVVAGVTKIDDAARAMVARRQAELLLNTGDFAGAKAAALRAVAASGGLTTRTSLSDVVVRSDAAIALLLAGQPDQARQYMAMTGAGRLPKGEFDPAAEMRAPDCGGEAGLKPDDVAVVEFSIADDGTVQGVAPVYAAGGGRVALEFARTVKEWWWPAERVAAIPAFFRYGARVEMRCSTAFPRPSIDDNVDAQVDRWLTGKGVDLPDAANGPAALAAQRAALATASAASPTSPTTLGALFRLSRNWALPGDERSALYGRAQTIAAAQDAPPVVRLAFDPAILEGGDRHERRRAALIALAASPLYAGDPQTRAILRLMVADRDLARRSGDQAAMPVLRQIVDDAALPKDDPLKVGALVRIASLEQRAGKVEAARTAFAATGLDAKQCALIDTRPKLVSAPGSEAFPREAQAWGFEGWAQVQFDIGADGRTATPRALLSYPPFIFTAASTNFLKAARFGKTYRPDGEPGCGGTTQRLIFKLPG